MADRDMAARFAAGIPDPAILRVGKVTRYSSTTITVAISDSDALINASYLFGAYQPILGDIVCVLKQGSQWLVLGSTTAPDQDNALTNGSFEASAVGSAPAAWGRYHDPAGTATATFTTENVRLGHEIDGPRALRLGLSVTGSFQDSDDYVYSDPIPVVSGQRWACAAYILGQADGPDDGLTGFAAISFTFHDNSTDVYPTTNGQSAVVNTYFSGKLPWILLRAPGDTGGIEIPAGITHIRVLLRSSLVWDAAIASVVSWSLFWDRVIARRIG